MTPIGAICRRGFLSLGGLVQHQNTTHPIAHNAPHLPVPPQAFENGVEGNADNIPEHAYERQHPILDGMLQLDGNMLYTNPLLE